MILIPHPRRGRLLVDAVLAPIVERMWRLGFDVDVRESTHAYTRDDGSPHSQRHDAKIEFRDKEVWSTHPDQEARYLAQVELDRVKASANRDAALENQTLTLAQRLQLMLETVEPGISHRPHWIWGRYQIECQVRSFLTLPEDDLPLLSELLAKVESQTEGGPEVGPELGLPLSQSTWHELNYQSDELFG